MIKSDITVKKEVALEKSTVSLLGENTRLTFGAGGTLLVRGEAELRLGTASSSGLLTIDSTDDTRPIIVTLDSARLVMCDGVTLGPSKSGGYAAGVQLQDQSKFYMYGGTITDCENWASVAGGVLVSEDTEFVLYDGVIQNCQGYQGGAVGVIERGKFTMMDGKIIDCIDHWYGGGAVSVFGTQAFFPCRAAKSAAAQPITMDMAERYSFTLRRAAQLCRAVPSTAIPRSATAAACSYMTARFRLPAMWRFMTTSRPWRGTTCS